MDGQTDLAPGHPEIPLERRVTDLIYIITCSPYPSILRSLRSSASGRTGNVNYRFKKTLLCFSDNFLDQVLKNRKTMEFST